MADIDEQLGADEIEAPSVDSLQSNVDSPSSTNQATSLNAPAKRFRAPTTDRPTETASSAPVGGWRGRLSSGFNRLSGVPKSVDQAKEKAKDKVKDEAKSAVKNTVKSGVKNVAKKVAASVAKKVAVSVAAATSEIWGPVLLVLMAIVGVIVIIAVIVGIAQTGTFGSSFHQDSDKNTQLIALANAGDVFARRQLDAGNITAFRSAMDGVEKEAKAKTPIDSDAIKIIEAIRTKLATYSSSDSKVDVKTLQEIHDLLDQLSAKGYGGVAASEIAIKIKALAYYYAGTTEGKQKYPKDCPFNDPTACNGFVIKVMHETGADLSYKGSALEQVAYVRRRTDCYDVQNVESTSQLAQGDIVLRPTAGRGGHGHVAIYIGNGQTAEASIGRNAHNPDIRPWDKVLSVAARLKGGVCAPAK